MKTETFIFSSSRKLWKESSLSTYVSIQVSLHSGRLIKYWNARLPSHTHTTAYYVHTHTCKHCECFYKITNIFSFNLHFMSSNFFYNVLNDSLRSDISFFWLSKFSFDIIYVFRCHICLHSSDFFTHSKGSWKIMSKQFFVLRLIWNQNFFTLFLLSFCKDTSTYPFTGVAARLRNGSYEPPVKWNKALFCSHCRRFTVIFFLILIKGIRSNGMQVTQKLFSRKSSPFAAK